MYMRKKLNKTNERQALLLEEQRINNQPYLLLAQVITPSYITFPNNSIITSRQQFNKKGLLYYKEFTS